MAKLIGIAGAPGSGKTTLCRLLATIYEKNYTVGCASEYARQFIRTYGQPEHLGIQTQFCYKQKLLEESVYTNKFDIVFSDSPTFLNYIYSMMMVGDSINAQEHKLLEDNYGWILGDLPRYEVIFLLPPRVAVDDGVRVTESIPEIDEMIRSFAKLHKHIFRRLMIIESESREEQANEILSYLKLNLNLEV